MKHKATTMTTLMIFAGLATVTGAPTAAAGDECRDSDWGWGWEYMDCEFSCNTGETVYVSISQQDSDYVDGSAVCGEARASCAEYDGSCSSRGLRPAEESGDASCTGSAYSGGSTDSHIQCGAGDADGLGKVQALLAKVGSNVEVSCATLFPSLEGVSGSWNVVHMNRFKGVFMSSDGCAEFEPAVTMDDGFTRYSLA